MIAIQTKPDSAMTIQRYGKRWPTTDARNNGLPLPPAASFSRSSSRSFRSTVLDTRLTNRALSPSCPELPNRNSLSQQIRGAISAATVYSDDLRNSCSNSRSDWLPSRSDR